MKTLDLADGGILLYDESFLPPDLASEYFAELLEATAWEQKPGVFGHLQPRMTASYGEPGVSYRYSGTENPAMISIVKWSSSRPGEWLNPLLLLRLPSGFVLR